VAHQPGGGKVARAERGEDPSREAERSGGCVLHEQWYCEDRRAPGLSGCDHVQPALSGVFDTTDGRWRAAGEQRPQVPAEADRLCGLSGDVHRGRESSAEGDLPAGRLQLLQAWRWPETVRRYVGLLLRGVFARGEPGETRLPLPVGGKPAGKDERAERRGDPPVQRLEGGRRGSISESPV